MKDKFRAFMLHYVLRLAFWLGYKENRFWFYAETSKVLKGELAPDGKIYYIMRATNETMRYSMSILLPVIKMDDNKRQMVFEQLIKKLVNKYRL